MTWEGRGVFEVSSADPDSTSPVWVDFTSRIRDVVQIPTLAIGRQNDLDQAEPARLSLVLDNSDDALTYGNTLSPYASWWGPGRKCRYREVIAGTSVPLFTGYIEVPGELLITSGIEQRVFVAASDRLARLDSAPAFTSTLAAHIISTGGSTLKAYYPMGDPDQPFRDVTGQQEPIRDHDSDSISSGFNGTQPFDPLQPAAAVLAPGDDLAVLRMTFDTVNSVGFRPLHGSLSGLTLSANEVLTAVCWVSLEEVLTTSLAAILRLLQVSLTETPGSAPLSMYIHGGPSAGEWHLTAPVGSVIGDVTGPLLSTYRAIPVALRYGFSPAVMELWVGSETFTTVPAGVAPTSCSINHIWAPVRAFQGLLGHVQLYVGAATAFTNADFLTQYSVGLTGYERQTTGDRIRKIAKFAGIADADMTQIDTGTTVMSRAELAGKTPLEAMREAETTEQGLLYVDGSGLPVFKDRRTLYNI